MPPGDRRRSGPGPAAGLAHYQTARSHIPIWSPHAHVRSDVVGSLLRPPFLLEARDEVGRGELTPAAFKQVEDRAVEQAVTLQQDAGLDVITDGEMRRYAFFGHLVDALEGFEKHSVGWSITFRDDAGHQEELQRPVVVDKLRWKRQMSVEEFTYLRGRTTRPAKVTLVSAQQAAAYYDPDRMIEACIELDNAIIANHPAGVTFGIHICRGNHKSMFYASGGYDRIAQQVFGRARFDRFLLEYDDARSGSFEPLRHVADDRIVVLGLVSSKTPALESPEELKARIAEASRIIPLERLALSAQCGFASTHVGNSLSADQQRSKLELVAGTALEVWS